LLSARLIDRLVLITFPIVLGRGKRLFGGSERPAGLKLVDHFVSSKGVVTTIYEPAGDVPTGTFETKEPSEQELQRRAKMEEGSW
jgi:dihydrofolate reductase